MRMIAGSPERERWSRRAAELVVRGVAGARPVASTRAAAPLRARSIAAPARATSTDAELSLPYTAGGSKLAIEIAVGLYGRATSRCTTN